MTDYTPEALEALSKKATQGVWQHAFRGGDTSEGDISCGQHSVLTVNGGNFGQWRDAPDDGEAEFKANGDFVCALVNAYRTGQLVHAVPSGEDAMVERVRQAIWDALRKGMPQQKVPKGRTDITALATAAITALDAVRGKQ